MKTTREEFHRLFGYEARPAYSILYPYLLGRQMPMKYPRKKTPISFVDRPTATRVLRKFRSRLRASMDAGDPEITEDIINAYYVCTVLRFADGSILTPQGVLFR